MMRTKKEELENIKENILVYSKTLIDMYNDLKELKDNYEKKILTIKYQIQNVTDLNNKKLYSNQILRNNELQNTTINSKQLQKLRNQINTKTTDINNIEVFLTDYKYRFRIEEIISRIDE